MANRVAGGTHSLSEIFRYHRCHQERYQASLATHETTQPARLCKYTPKKTHINLLSQSLIITTIVTPQQIFAKTPLEKTSLWAARKEALFTMLNTRPPGTEIWSTDVAVPLSQLANLITLTKQDCSQLNLFASIIGHVGDANFHTAILYDPRDAEQTAAVGKVVKQMMRRALEMEGTVSGEHAIGIGKKEGLKEEVGGEVVDVMRRVKRAVDGKGIMNPGKVFDLS